MTGGMDFTQYWKDKKYFTQFKMAGSQISGTKESIRDLQLSSRRYFQRPDVEYFRYDPQKTSLSGTGGTLLIGNR